MAKPWIPSPLPLGDVSTDYMVDSEAQADAPHARPPRYRSLQAAIDRACRDAATDPADRHRVIYLCPGHYPGPFLIPASGPALALLGAGPDVVTLSAGIDAQMTGGEFNTRFGPTIAGYGPEARRYFFSVGSRQRLTTGHTAVLRIEKDDTIVACMTIRNDYACDRRCAAPDGAEPDVEGRFAQGQHQAVATHIAAADRVYLHDLHLISFQDTLYLQTPPSRLSRTQVTDCLIEGDVDFIFGGGTAHFENCEIRSRGARGARSWAIAPSTSLWRKHGFVLDHCTFSHDGAETGRDGQSFLGRQWFEGVRATPYGRPPASYKTVLGDTNHLSGDTGTITRSCLEAVGKCSLQDCRIGTHIAPDQRWDDWAAGPWTARYRVVQTSIRDFVDHLKEWESFKLAEYADHLDMPDWLREEYFHP